MIIIEMSYQTLKFHRKRKKYENSFKFHIYKNLLN